jgi:transposase
LHYLPGFAPELNPDELVWSHMKSTGTAKKPLRRGDQLQPRIDTDLRAIQRDAKLVRSFFRAPHVAYIADV